MKIKELEKLLYSTARVRIYDSNDGFYCYPRYKGEAEYIPDIFKDREIRAIDSETTNIAIILENEYRHNF